MISIKVQSLNTKRSNYIPVKNLQDSSSELLSGIPQGSILGTPLFRIDINILFWLKEHINLGQILEVIINKSLNFKQHIQNICKKDNKKLTALKKFSRWQSFKNRRRLMKTFVESQFAYNSLT